MPNLPYLNSYWVIPDKFLAGAYPGSWGEENARQKLRTLIQAGITCIIDLTQPGENFYSYKNQLLEEASDYQVEVEWLNFPILDYNIPGVVLMKEILDTIDQRLDSGKKIYIHCIGGIGRTGTTVACYLVRHGLSGEDALARIQELRAETPNCWQRSPESDEQVDFVLNWQVAQ
jgi:protein-tyrosine phosphatase